METAGFGLRLASSVITPLIKRLFRPDGPGAGLVGKPVRLSSLVTFRGEKRTLSEKDLRKLTSELVARAVRATAPYDAPTAEEQQEVADALATSLGRLGELDMDIVPLIRNGPGALAERIIHPAHLSLTADALYQGLLRTTCLHILNFFTQRTTFVPRELVEQSRQLDQLVRRIDLLAERFPPQSALDTTFEGRYARHVVTRHSELTIYGIDLHESGEWPLDTAYLSLRATRRTAGQPPHAGGVLAPPPEPAERALAGRERVLLRGEAGSGKTTLVQWLAVSTARQEAVGGEQAHLLGRVPFVLPLRTLTRGGRELPAPEAFLTAVSCPIAGAQPEGWTDRVLGAGRGLLLVDGIDEIPEPEREPARRWLHELLDAYPGNLWLVTARPSAVRDDWLTADDFAELSLMRMGQEDVAAFVHRWHRAAGAGQELERALLHALRTTPDLGRLATNPLMCGLICALHRERRGYLPRGRKALYDAALLMLLERRDRERGLSRGGMELDAEAQTLLLQKLAYWLIRNGRAEMDRTVALDLIERVLPSMPVVAGQGSPGAVLRHLLERSGLLREPSPGAVDFVHRTFQDYLGAREAVEERDIPLLVENAHRDQWGDVIRMSVAHARADERARLLAGLIRRGDEDPAQRIRLHLLAMACLEHATRLDPEVRSEVERRAATLIPPRTRREAVALAEVGPVVLELLPGPDGLTDREAAAVVETARHIATESAISKLAQYRDHPSAGVLFALGQSWGAFRNARYAEEILSHLPAGTDLMPECSKAAELRLIARLPGCGRVALSGEITAREITDELGGTAITELSLGSCPTIDDLGFLGTFPKLERLTLLVLGLTDLTSLTTQWLRELDLISLPRIRDLRCLNAMPRLRRLNVTDVDVAHLGLLPERAPLEVLHLRSGISDLAGIGCWPRLTELTIDSAAGPPTPESWHAVAGLPELEHLEVSARDFASLAAHGEPLTRLSGLTLLSADQADLRQLARCFPQVSRVTLWQPEGSALDLAPLATLDTLRELTIDGEADLLNADGLPSHVQLIAPPRSRY